MYEDFKPHVELCTACPERATHFINMGFRAAMCDKHYESFMSWSFVD